MELELLKKRFDTPKLNKYLEQLNETTEGEFWASIAAIKEIFPKADIYHAGSSKFGYLGVGITPESNVRVKEFTLVCSLNENYDEDGHYYIEYGVIKNLYTYIKTQDAQVPQSFEPVTLQIEEFKVWLKQIKKYATEFNFELNGQALLPSDYQEDFNFTTEEAYQYLTKSYQVIEVEKDNKKIVGFKNTKGRECALNLEVKNPSIFIGIDPEDNQQFAFSFLKTQTDVSGKYLEYEGRHSGLENNAPSLYTGHKAFYISLNSFQELEKFCDWYEQSDDQTTALECKVKAFLESWPIDRIKDLTIEDYHQASNELSFIIQVDLFNPAEDGLTMSNYYEIWQPITLGKSEDYHNEIPYSWHKRLGDESNLAFAGLKQEILNLLEAVQHRDLNAIDQIAFNASLKWMIAFLYQDFSDPFIIPIVSEPNRKRIGYAEYARKPLPEFLPILLAGQGTQAFFPYVEKLFAMIKTHYWNNKKQKSLTKKDEVMIQQTLNRILFGAAGTGKTYHTINHALSIIEHKPLELLEKEDRTALKTRFDQYKDQGQIKFVTFHQSFSYEDFVEGIRAETDEAGNLTYPVKAGVFKEICDKEQQILKALDALIEQARHKRIDIATKSGEKFQIGTNPNTGNLITIAVEGTGSEKALNKSVIINYLRDQTDYIIPNKNYEWAVARFLRPVVNKNYVLIIDEINRGNISRIFGELITLIEDSKRKGEEEALSVTLPYSKNEFSVPKNVYLIGTMNSSDRSLTGLDIALRRRFTFIEMPPKPELLDDISVDGLNIGELLKVINQRIEVLLDRDHCIGHANFMSLKEQPTLEHLTSIFKQKIIPQLQEYFFDDWSKINMVLNANGMLKSKTVERSVLFPNVDTDSDGFFEEQKAWELVHTAFESIETFNKIIRH
ncbi:McrB family protein [Acinetobacter terrestris]|uniref:McrB family protein n=1 Tax=Acinetobacter terrestris TaxID=2529843 RepID=UPI003525D47C